MAGKGGNVLIVKLEIVKGVVLWNVGEVEGRKKVSAARVLC